MKLIDVLSVAALIIGLLIAAGGAWWTANSVIIDEETADALAGTYFDKNEALKRALIEQSRSARNGLALIVVGSGFQILGVLLPIVWRR